MYGYDTSTIAPPFKLFMAPLQVEFTPEVLEKIEFAYVCSKYGHQGQLRDDGSRYFDHPKGAAWIYINEFNGRDPRVIIDILLHDISEDSRLLSPYRIALNFGKDIALDVRSLTKLSEGKETTEIYLRRIVAQGVEAIMAKLFDCLHNTRTLGGCILEKQERQAEEVITEYLPILASTLRQYGEDYIGLTQLLRNKIEEALKEVKK